jgi:nicotinamide mononucleotide transporter
MLDFFLNPYKNASSTQIFLETIAFVFGILSVWFAKKQNILVYPTGIVATIITSYLLFKAGYLGDMCINAYFTIMSFYGWFFWAKGKTENYLKISKTNKNEKIIGILLFFATIFVVFSIYIWFDYRINPDNYIDMISSGLFFTAMWYMAKKKLENWTLWIIGNLMVVPLYAYRGLGILSLQYVIFTILAVMAFIEWNKNYNKTHIAELKKF